MLNAVMGPRVAYIVSVRLAENCGPRPEVSPTLGRYRLTVYFAYMHPLWTVTRFPDRASRGVIYQMQRLTSDKTHTLALAFVRDVGRRARRSSERARLGICTDGGEAAVSESVCR